MIDTRQQQILRTLVLEHLRTSDTVSSKTLALNFELSSATVRNEMGTLEGQGYICQPYTSAGRVPTEKGYKFFVEHFLATDDIETEEKKLLTQMMRLRDRHQAWRRLVKALAHLTDETAFVVEDEEIFLGGLAHLMGKPEFHAPQVLQGLSAVLDELDERVWEVADNISGLSVLIGSDNPLYPNSSVLIFQYTAHDHSGVVGLLGPMRMDYSKNYSLLNYMYEMMDA